MSNKTRFCTGTATLFCAATIVMSLSGLAFAQTPDPMADPTADMLTVVAGFAGEVVSQHEIPVVQAVNVVGPAGGQATSPSGRLILQVPPEALAADTDIVISEQEPDEGPTVGPVFDLQPEGLAFAKPATLSIHYTPDDVPEGYDLEDIAIMEIAPAEGEDIESFVEEWGAK